MCLLVSARWCKGFLESSFVVMILYVFRLEVSLLPLFCVILCFVLKYFPLWFSVQHLSSEYESSGSEFVPESDCSGSSDENGNYILIINYLSLHVQYEQGGPAHFIFGKLAYTKLQWHPGNLVKTPVSPAPRFACSPAWKGKMFLKDARYAGV